MEIGKMQILRLILTSMLLFYADHILAAQWFATYAATYETKTGTAQGPSVRENDRVLAFFKAQKRLVYRILKEQLGIAAEDIPADIRAAIEKPQTKNFEAFVAFSEGLDLLDGERFKEAMDAFQKAIDLDPEFGMAAGYRERLQVEHGMSEQTQVEIRGARKKALGSLLGSKKARLVRTSGTSRFSQLLQELAQTQASSDAVTNQSQAAGQDEVKIEGDLKLTPGAGSGDINSQLGL